ncbi:MAG: IS200/IS605 family transposase [Gemmatimonadales bacterium]
MAAHRLYFHLTWSTLGRRPMIDASTRTFLDAFIRRTAVREGAEVVELSLLRTHVHVIVRTPLRFDLSRLAQMLKGGSSYAASRLPGNVLGLRWNRRYSVTTVSPRSLPQAAEYLRTQETRHPQEVITASKSTG